jgi:MraZ protein
MVTFGRIGFFTGEYKHNLTDKNRIALPRRIRVEIDGDEVVLSKGSDTCIEGFDKAKWQEMVKIHLELPFTDMKGREIRRQVFSSAVLAEVDRQGRIVLPEQILTWIGLKGKIGESVVIVGVGDHFELWNEKSWSENSK